VANRTRLMRELILIALSGQPDIEVVDEVQDETVILPTVEQSNPDFVIITQDTLGERPGICDTLLRQRPELRIIAIIPHHNSAVCYSASLNISSRDVEASEEAFLGVLRTKARATVTLT
jgi:DNA-binding NarL/FixJ family response regulator